MRVYAGIDLAAKGSHEAFGIGQDGEVILRGHRFGTEAGEIDNLRAKIPGVGPRAEVHWISEPRARDG